MCTVMTAAAAVDDADVTESLRFAVSDGDYNFVGVVWQFRC